ncbi:MAG: acetyl-CoA decarbonylase/synthase complex subunit gamma [Candidatus Thorarchaeota archaeon]
MSPKAEPLQIQKLLPRTNCGICGEKTCLSFAMKVRAKDLDLKACTPLIEETQWAENYTKLKELLAPPVNLVKVGIGDHEISLGGEEVLHRHELSFFYPTALAVVVHDKMSEDELSEKVKFINDVRFEKIGIEIPLDMICLRSVSGDPTVFQKAIQVIRKISKYPLILASYDPKVIAAGLEVDAANRPLIYAATRDNWQEMANLALNHNCPLVISAPGDLNGLMTLSNTLKDAGIDLVLDPGTYSTVGDMGEAFRNFVRLREAAIEENKLAGWPILGVPAVVALEGRDKNDTALKESLVASMQLARYADLLILNSTQYWALMPLPTLRMSIYQDPRIHPGVDPGVFPIGKVTKYSPMCMTTNFALTYHTVRADIEATKVPTWLVVVDTGALGVEAAAAGGQLNTDVIKETLEKFKAEENVSHKTIIFPALAARFSGEVEDATGWKVVVGPKDSADIKKVLVQ